MKTGWVEKTIGEVCDVVNGGTPKTGVAAYWGGVHQWITPAEMGKRDTPYVDCTERTLTNEGLQNSSARPLPAYSVILSSRAPIGHLVINTQPMATNQGCKGLVPRQIIDHKFLFYFLTNNVGLLNDLGTGTTFKELSGGKLKEVKIPFPSLAEQKQIVTILDEALEGIASATANAEKNLANARRLFDQGLHSAFADVWQPRNLVTLDTLAADITDGDHMPPPKSSSGVPFITIGNVDKETHRIDFSDTFFVSKDYYNDLKPNKKPIIGDVLYTVTGSFGITVLISENTDFCFQRHIGLVRPKPDVDSEWLYYLLMSPQVAEQANAGATGTAQKTVSLKVLRGFQVPRIPVPLQKIIAEKLKRARQMTVALEGNYKIKIAALEELKKSLLKKAFAGELTLENTKAAKKVATA